MENDYQLEIYGLGKYRQLLGEASQRRNTNRRELLAEIETAIKAEYDAYCTEDITGIRRNPSGKRCIQILLEARKRVMNKMYVLNEEDFDHFKTINTTLFDLTSKLVGKLYAIYRHWLDNEEVDWNKDCEVCGKVIAEGWKKKGNDDTGSDYNTLLPIIEDMTDSPLFKIEFSGSQDRKIDDIKGIYFHPASGGHLFSFGGPQPFGDFVMCSAFDHLLIDSYYSRQDILRIELFWADADITHQRIVTSEGRHI